MTTQATSGQPVDPSSSQPSFVFVGFDVEIGPVRVLVPAGASVEYEAYYVKLAKCYGLMVWVNHRFVGWHCGELTGSPITFVRKSDAVRLADVRNAAWRARMDQGQPSLHARRQTPGAKRQTPKGGRQVAAYPEPVLKHLGGDVWSLDR